MVTGTFRNANGEQKNPWHLLFACAFFRLNSSAVNFFFSCICPLPLLVLHWQIQSKKKEEIKKTLEVTDDMYIYYYAKKIQLTERFTPLFRTHVIYFILFNLNDSAQFFFFFIGWLVELVKRMRNAGNTFIDGITVFNLIYSLLIVHSLSLRALCTPLSVMAWNNQII